MKRINALALAGPAALLLAAFFVAPYVSIVVMSFREASARAPYGAGLTLEHYRRALGDGYILATLARTLGVGFVVTLATLLLGYPLAYHLARARTRAASWLYMLVLSPLLVGVVVRTFGWLILLSPNGVINQGLAALGLAPLALMNNTLGVVIALTHVLLPFVILPLLANLQAIPPDLTAAGRSLGASRARVFFKVTLPLSLPGLQAGAILAFVLSTSAYVTPAMLGGPGGRTLSVLVVQYLVDNFRWPAGAALALILAAVASAVVVVFVIALDKFMRRLP